MESSSQNERGTMRRVALVVKLVVLAALLWFAISRLQIADQLVLPAEAQPQAGAGFEVIAGAEGPVARFEPSVGETLVLGPSDRLVVLESAGDRGDYEVEWAGEEGERRFSVPATWVEPAGFLALQPGIASTMRSIDPLLLALAVLCFGPPTLLLAARWGFLLRANDIVLPYLTLVRLTFIGLFFNTFIPGGAGGDLVKAVAVGRYTDRQTEAVTLILVDRVLGVAVLVLFGMISILIAFPGETALVVPAVALAVALAVGAALYFSTTWRRVVRFDSLLGLLPFSDTFRRADRAVFRLRERPRQLAYAVLTAIALQLVGILAISIAGRSLGLDQVRLSHYFFVVPVAYLFNAVPISPGGLGLLEVAFQQLLSQAGVASPSEGFMLGVLARLMIVVWGLPGLVLWLLSGERKAGQETESSQEAESGIVT